MDNSKSNNRLVSETSPYLMQHAHQSVDWFPWGPEALEKALREDKPIFLSIGYSACHWCHVMARESFDDAATAELMNRWFINIKVDREERPDLDAVYMQAVLALTGQGGWPLNVFLTPGKEPYFGGTYFPPAAKSGRPGFPQILKEAHDLYRQESEPGVSRTAKIMSQLQSPAAKEEAKGHSSRTLMAGAVSVLAGNFDPSQGGFGAGMKFPDPMIYALLLRHWVQTGEDGPLRMVDLSLTRMAEGGMYDQIGGGFHRYSTDKDWRVPHFEKMLYDNALLARLYLEVFQATKQDIYREIAAGVFEYVFREMTSPEGAFYSSQDADTRHGEGHYFTWELREVLDLLGPRHAKVFARAYGLTASGHLQRRNVLRVAMDPEQVAKSENMAIFEVDHILKSGRKTLFEARGKRPPPARDAKILAGWNGLMISALALGHRVLNEPRYRDAALSCARFLWSKLWTGDRLWRVYTDGGVRVEGFLEDYASLLEGFLALYEATFDLDWIRHARTLADAMIDRFQDGEAGGFFMTGQDQEKLIVRPKTAADESIPAANGLAALALLKLGALLGEDRYVQAGRGVIEAFRPQVEARPTAHATLLAAMDFDASSRTEVVISGPETDPAYRDLMQAVYQDFRPHKILAGFHGNESKPPLPFTQGRGPLKGLPTAYLCLKQTCHAPVHSGEALLKLLERPPIIRLNIFDEDKAKKDMEKKEQGHFLNAMSKIFKISGLDKR